MLYLEKPSSFQPKFSVAGCFIMCGGKILLLQRQDHKPQGGTWGVPGGKVELNEDPEQAVKREVFEETGIQIQQPLRQLKTTYVNHDGYEFIYLMYSLDLAEKPFISLDTASHKDFTWIKPAQLHTLPYIPDLDQHMSLFLEQKHL